MQLILDAETAIGLQNKMSGINEDTLDDKLAKNIIPDFPNNLTDDKKQSLENVENIRHVEKELSKHETASTNIGIEENERTKELNKNVVSDSGKDCTKIRNIPDEKNGNLVNGVDDVKKDGNSVFVKISQNDISGDGAKAESNDHVLENETNKNVDNKVLEDKSKSDDDGFVVKGTKTEYKDSILDDKTKIEVGNQTAKEDEIIKFDSSLEECCETTDNGTISNMNESDNDNTTPQDNAAIQNIENKEEMMSDDKEKNSKLDDTNEKNNIECVANVGDSKSEYEKEINNVDAGEADCYDKEEKLDQKDSSMEVEDVDVKRLSSNKNEDEKIEKLQQNSESIEVPPQNVDKDKAEEINELLDDSKMDQIEMPSEGKKSQVSKLANMLDIISDDEGDKSVVSEILRNNNKCDQSISLVDDDDIMLIEEEDTCEKMVTNPVEKVTKSGENAENDMPDQSFSNDNKIDKICDTEAATSPKNEKAECAQNDSNKKDAKPLLPSNLLKTCKKNLADMTREDLEEFCLLKIVESVVDRSNLGDIKAQLKTMARTVEEYKKKMMMVTKQSRDLQVILKSVQEEQKKPSVYPVTPLKITRSVGMQVLMTDKPCPKRKKPGATANHSPNQDKANRNTVALRPIAPKTNQQIPVPRLVPATVPTNKANTTIQPLNSNTKPTQTNTTVTNGMRNSPPAQKPEKRTRLQSITVDLTDDEPPSKMTSRNSPVPPVRLVPPQNLLAPQRQPFPTNINSPRKVYIPISSPQSQGIRPGQTILLKSVPPNQGQRPRGPSNSLGRMQTNCIRMNKVQSNRHPAPLPDAMKQYQPPNWKALPPAPELQLSRVDNGIVISWKIEGYQEENYEEISSYQLYAYQETTGPPSTALWKKIGDVKALPLPMACTLTQFLSGYKYYFAVRAVDAKSRLGPFSLPASILHFNKT